MMKGGMRLCRIPPDFFSATDILDPKCRSAAKMAEEGYARVYFDYVKNVQKLVAARGKTMMFWGDAVFKYLSPCEQNRTGLCEQNRNL